MDFQSRRQATLSAIWDTMKYTGNTDLQVDRGLQGFPLRRDSLSDWLKYTPSASVAF
jgi:hypothetical protein